MKRNIVTPEKALERLETLCARGEQAVFDLRRKLYMWGITAADSERIIESLEQRRFVDDDRFARAYCRDKYRFNRWGRMKIKMGLIQKHIDSGTIAGAMEEIDEDLYRENLRVILRQKIKTLGADANTYEGRTRLFRHAVSRGYETDIVAAELRNNRLWEPEES